jgi:DNA (cytosine-5)-methyltransferase 1
MAKPLWFVKSKRAQTSDDDETWLQGGVVPTLNAFDMGDTRATVIIFYGQRVGDVRVQDDKINTLQARMGTGGNNMPMLATVFPIDDGREVEKNQNGTGIGNEGDPAYTLDRLQSPAVAIAVDIYNATIDKDVTHTLKAANQPMGVPSVLTSTVFPTLSATNNPSRSPQSSEVTAQIDAMVKATSTVRRLTPTECERLQGFPDGWTDGQADSHRYKQMGNAVAVPVVEWIINRLTN